ncbi:MAG: chorismate mutase [Mycobacterium sp.]|nr:chorismate mutase [Mycobacterium sp.]MBW0016963.1 chorismate mutase [Mycobacterium sp.]
MRLTTTSSSAVAVFGLLLTVLTAPPVGADISGPLNALVDAAAQRLQVAESVAAAKWTSHGDIEDLVRVRQELTKLRAQATAEHIDPDYVARVFGDQIQATEAIEYSRFSDWKLDPASAPAAPPDLSASRSVIDGLNQTMVTQIAMNWELLHSPACDTQLDDARAGVARARQLEDLYQRALLAATQSYCA